jgi:cation:H+ antiporter
MPKTMNAVIWVRQGKERLALANISGAMMILLFAGALLIR